MQKMEGDICLGGYIYIFQSIDSFSCLNIASLYREKCNLHFFTRSHFSTEVQFAIFGEVQLTLLNELKLHFFKSMGTYKSHIVKAGSSFAFRASHATQSFQNEITSRKNLQRWPKLNLGRYS